MSTEAQLACNSELENKPPLGVSVKSAELLEMRRNMSNRPEFMARPDSQAMDVALLGDRESELYSIGSKNPPPPSFRKLAEDYLDEVSLLPMDEEGESLGQPRTPLTGAPAERLAFAEWLTDRMTQTGIERELIQEMISILEQSRDFRAMKVTDYRPLGMSDWLMFKQSLAGTLDASMIGKYRASYEHEVTVPGDNKITVLREDTPLAIKAFISYLGNQGNSWDPELLRLLDDDAEEEK